MPEDTLVTIAAFSIPVEAHAARLRLEAEGIECWIQDEHTIGWDFLLSNAMGGVKLQVRAGDGERAAKVLGEPGSRASKTPAAATNPCPQCGAGNHVNATYERGAGVLRFLFIAFLCLLTFLPLSWPWRRRRCLSCGAVWKA